MPLKLVYMPESSNINSNRMGWSNSNNSPSCKITDDKRNDNPTYVCLKHCSMLEDWGTPLQAYAKRVQMWRNNSIKPYIESEAVPCNKLWILSERPHRTEFRIFSFWGLFLFPTLSSTSYKYSTRNLNSVSTSGIFFSHSSDSHAEENSPASS